MDEHETTTVHRTDRYRGRRTPKLLPRALELLERHGYPTDVLSKEHEAVFGKPLVKMDLDARWGEDLTIYLIRHPHHIDRAISRLGDPTPNGRR